MTERSKANQSTNDSEVSSQLLRADLIQASLWAYFLSGSLRVEESRAALRGEEPEKLYSLALAATLLAATGDLLTVMVRRGFEPPQPGQSPGEYQAILSQALKSLNP